MDGGVSADILARLRALHPTEIDLSLDRLRRLLQGLDNPQRRTPPVLHIAGTNGKGSVAAFLEAGLAADGARVHAYTTPHLARFHERIRLNGAPVGEGALTAALRAVEGVNAGAPITFFEATTAAAFLLFADQEADWLVLEVGMGGRDDATNVDAPVRASVITPISFDHQEFLGPTLAEIARAKAGVLRRGAPAVVSRQRSEAEVEILRAAGAVGAPTLIQGRDWDVRLENGRLVFEDGDGLLDLPQPRLRGAHQVDNAGAAIAALRVVGATEAALTGAMTDVRHPARLQRLRAGPLVSAAPPGAELWLDGGHNPAAGAALATYFADLEERAPAPLFLVVGMLSRKDAAGFLSPFAGLARRAFTVTIASDADARPAADLAKVAISAGLPAEAAITPMNAIRALAGEPLGAAPPRLLLCGSLAFAGEILRDHR